MRGKQAKIVSPTQERAILGYLATTRYPTRDRVMFLSLNLSHFVAHKHWERRCASPRRFSANLLEIGESQRWLLASMPPNFDLLQTAIN
jgi:hypothetical protein